MKSTFLCDVDSLTPEIVAQEAVMWAEYDMEQATGHERVIVQSVDNDDYEWWNNGNDSC